MLFNSILFQVFSGQAFLVCILFTNYKNIFIYNIY